MPASSLLNIHLINLDRSKDRLATFHAVNNHVMPHIVRFSAVDGKAVERTDFVERGIIAADLGYKDGALGNALSHIALWDRAILENQSLTICEDDAIFNRSFCAASATVLQQLPPDWDVILWGWNFDSMLWFDMIPGVSSCIGWFDQDSLRKGIDAFQSANVRPRSFRLFQAFGTVCYSISSNGARSLRQSCLPLRNSPTYVPGLRSAVANSTLDVGLNSAYRRINSFVSVPPLVVTANDHSLTTVHR
jgi:glycosyl transferase, family 25